MRSVLLSGLFIFFSHARVEPGELKKFQINGIAQGTTYHITYYAEDSIVTKKQIDSLLDQVDSSLSLYKPFSLINQFNRSGKGIVVDDHFIKVVKKAKEVHRLTNGIFDITVFPLTDAWGFGPARKDTMPDDKTIAQLRSCVNSSFIEIKGEKVIKKKPCVKLDANGIAQGYSVDVLADFFEERGIVNYLVELGGEIRVKGRKPGGEKISIGIEAPGDDPMFAVIEKVIYLSEGAVTTSGNYRRYHESNGKKITHLINPKTGYTLQNELVSVTIYAKDAITADGYDNAIMAMGLKKGLAFVEKSNQLAAHFIYRKKDGTIADTISSRFRPLLQP
jgi:thiamine biosynthesis lipoprotein